MQDQVNITGLNDLENLRSIKGEDMTYRLYSGSILSCFFRLLSLVGSENLKNVEANSTSHLQSIEVTSRMYSFVVRTSS